MAAAPGEKHTQSPRGRTKADLFLQLLACLVRFSSLCRLAGQLVLHILCRALQPHPVPSLSCSLLLCRLHLLQSHVSLCHHIGKLLLDGYNAILRGQLQQCNLLLERLPVLQEPHECMVTTLCVFFYLCDWLQTRCYLATLQHPSTVEKQFYMLLRQ